MNKRAEKRGQKYAVHLNTRVSHEQMQQIRDSAYVAGMSVCRYVRHRATGSTVVSKLDAKIARELNRIGGWLVVLTKNGEDVSEAITELREAVAKIRE